MVRATAERRWSGVGDFEFGQWRYQLVEACPRDLTGNRLASVGDSRNAPPFLGRKRLYEIQAGNRIEGPREGPLVFSGAGGEPVHGRARRVGHPDVAERGVDDEWCAADVHRLDDACS